VPAQRLNLVDTDFTKDDAALSAELEVNAEKRGNKIPRFDAMIAAVAINRGIKLFTSGNAFVDFRNYQSIWRGYQSTTKMSSITKKYIYY